MFDFDYRGEMDTPVAQRRYGYYVLPILHRGRLVGRLDPKADRQTKTLIVRAIYLEPAHPLDEDLLAGMTGALREFMAFHRSQRLCIEHSEPEALGPVLLERLPPGAFLFLSRGPGSLALLLSAVAWAASSVGSLIPSSVFLDP